MVDSVEHQRLESDRRAWASWGPYLSERAWGTVREDYSPDGEVWQHFPFDHARSRAYRWNEDGLAGICDSDQHLCFAFSFWNGRDPILKERLFGLNGDEGNHGEDPKECWWYSDATPTASYLRWQYAYPQSEFPYQDLRDENARRSRLDREYELDDTGIFADSRYWDIQVEYAKDGPTDICIVVRAHNRGPDTETLHVLPTLWHRNTWSHVPQKAAPAITLNEGRLHAVDQRGGAMQLTGDGDPTAVFCDNETNAALIWGAADTPSYPKDGINDHVIAGQPTVNPDQTGSKAALWYQLTVEPGDVGEIRLRLSGDNNTTTDIDGVVEARRADADDFYDQVIPSVVTAEDRRIAREALAGMVWGKQFYAFDVDLWLEGDPGMTTPDPARKQIRNNAWRHHSSADVISMPDPWEYPWYAAWDLAFHCIPLAHIDPVFAKDQLELLCRGHFMHPNGQLPAYEWSFSDTNPPVHAMAALEVFRIDGSRDIDFLTTIFNKLLLNFTWWVNRKDGSGNNVFEGGFLGLDNIGPLDRSEGIPEGYLLEQSDGTAWMASFALQMLEIALELSEHDAVYDDMAIKFFEHFAYIATAIHERGLWDEESGFYYDVLRGEGQTIPLAVKSMVGLLPLMAVARLPVDRVLTPSEFADHFLWFVTHRQRYAANVMGARENLVDDDVPAQSMLLAIADLDRAQRVLEVMLDPAEFLSPFGIRSMSAAHRDRPFSLSIGGMQASVGYEPGESESGLFGGNSNWRGPIWFPVNYLLLNALGKYDAYAGQGFKVAYPTGSNQMTSLGDISDDIADRLVGLFRANPEGARPFTGLPNEDWHGRLLFHEYFDGDTGRGLGASHQTGWTGLVADLIIRRGQKDMA